MGREVWQSGDFRFAGGVGGSHHHRVTEGLMLAGLSGGFSLAS
jgi:hypothetical protein